MSRTAPAPSGVLRIRHPPSLYFGPGAIVQLPAVLAELGLGRPLVVTDARLAELGLASRIVDDLAAGGITAVAWPEAQVDPHDGHAHACAEALRAGGHDSVMALGGGSVVDLAKVAALLARHPGPIHELYGLDAVKAAGLPLIAVPTTAGGGGEVSSHAVLMHREPRKKEVVSGPFVLPAATLVDPWLTLTLPWRETLHAALDGLIHAIEAFVARKANVFSDSWVRQALPRILSALPRLKADPADLAAREELSLGCLFSSLAMANASAGAIHALGYPLNLHFGVPHGLANAIMAPSLLTVTCQARPERCAELAGLFIGRPARAAELPSLVASFFAGLGLSEGLADWSIGEKDLDWLAREATAYGPVLANTPIQLSEADLATVYRDAWQSALEEARR